MTRRTRTTSRTPRDSDSPARRPLIARAPHPLFFPALILLLGAGSPVLGVEITRVEVLRVQTPAHPIRYPVAPELRVQVSPDGRFRLFVRDHPAEQRGVWLQDYLGRLTLVRREGTTPRWSSAGDRFALIAPRTAAQPYPSSVFVYRLAPLRLERRIDIHPRDFLWEPRGTRLAIAGYREWTGPRPAAVLAVAEAGLGAVWVVAETPWLFDATSGGWWQAEIPGFAWSPDGALLAYSLVERAVLGAVIVEADLYLASPDARLRQRLTTTTLVSEVWPRWSGHDRIVAIRSTYARRPPTPEAPLPFRLVRVEEVQYSLRRR